MAEKKKQTSIFMYTALIFLVALIMIALSFFGQTNINEKEELNKKAQTLTERATIVSEENLVLSKENTELKKSVDEKEQNINSLNKESEAYKNLINAYERIYENNIDAAREIITQVDPAVLNSDDAQNLYNQIIEATKE